MVTAASLLGNVPFFHRLDDEARAALARAVTVTRLPAGTTLFAEGDPGDALFIVRAGKVELSVTDDTGARIVLAVAGPGDCFGELSLLDGGPRTASATAAADVEMLRLDHAALNRFLHAHPAAALDLLQVVGGRLRATDERLRRVVSRNANDEIADTRSRGQRVADRITAFIGSMAFLLLNAGLFAAWIAVSLGLVPGLPAFDPVPFALLSTAVSVEAIFLSTFVLITQNGQSTKDRVRAEIEYEVNLKAELEIAHLHRKVDLLNAALQTRLDGIERALKGGRR